LALFVFTKPVVLLYPIFGISNCHLSNKGDSAIELSILWKRATGRKYLLKAVRNVVIVSNHKEISLTHRRRSNIGGSGKQGEEVCLKVKSEKKKKTKF